MMKRWLVILPVLLLLAGCAEDAPQDTTGSTSATAAVQATEPDPGLYDPGHIITRQTGGAVLSYPLDAPGYTMTLMGEKILLSAVSEEGLLLTLLSGENCTRESRAVVTGLDGTARIWACPGKVVCYDSVTGYLILLDGRLKETQRIKLPKTEYRSMAMDSGLTTLYYSESNQICAFDLSTEISRLLRRSEGHAFEITGIENDTLLQCWTVGEDGAKQKELISCQDGQVRYAGQALHSVAQAGDAWTAVWFDGPVTQLLYGKGEEMQLFRPRQGSMTLLSDGNILSAYRPKDVSQVLDLYDMNAGALTASVTLKETAAVTAPERNAAGIWFIATDGEGGQTLCCWKPELSPAEPVECLFKRYTRKDPDTEGLAKCSAYAKEIGEKYGITVSLEAPEALAQDYRIQTEYHADAIYAALEAVDHALSQFPERYYQRVVRVTATRTFHISLVRRISGAGGEAVPDGRGLQVWKNGDPYILVAVGSDTLDQFYHQLWHMTETYVLTRNSVLDTWDWMNPEDFHYLESYKLEQLQDPERYLSGEDRAFIDAFSKTYPREDRAVIMTYAMKAGNEALFESEIMQEKLNSLCWSIRRAFKWEKEKTVFPWEQYLNEPPYGSMI